MVKYIKLVNIIFTILILSLPTIVIASNQYIAKFNNITIILDTKTICNDKILDIIRKVIASEDKLKELRKATVSIQNLNIEIDACYAPIYGTGKIWIIDENGSTGQISEDKFIPING